MKGVHICVFRGERLPPLEQEPPYKARVIRGGRWVEVTITPPPPKAIRCEFETPKGQCTRKTFKGAKFAWGTMALCDKHLDEECGPETPAGGAP